MSFTWKSTTECLSEECQLQHLHQIYLLTYSEAHASRPATEWEKTGAEQSRSQLIKCCLKAGKDRLKMDEFISTKTQPQPLWPSKGASMYQQHLHICMGCMASISWLSPWICYLFPLSHGCIGTCIPVCP